MALQNMKYKNKLLHIIALIGIPCILNISNINTSEITKHNSKSNNINDNINIKKNTKNDCSRSPSPNNKTRDESGRSSLDNSPIIPRRKNNISAKIKNDINIYRKCDKSDLSNLTYKAFKKDNKNIDTKDQKLFKQIENQIKPGKINFINYKHTKSERNKTNVEKDITKIRYKNKNSRAILNNSNIVNNNNTREIRRNKDSRRILANSNIVNNNNIWKTQENKNNKDILTDSNNINTDISNNNSDEAIRKKKLTLVTQAVNYKFAKENEKEKALEYMLSDDGEQIIKISDDDKQMIKAYAEAIRPGCINSLDRVIDYRRTKNVKNQNNNTNIDLNAVSMNIDNIPSSYNNGKYFISTTVTDPKDSTQKRNVTEIQGYSRDGFNNINVTGALKINHMTDETEENVKNARARRMAKMPNINTQQNIQEQQELNNKSQRKPLKSKTIITPTTPENLRAKYGSNNINEQYKSIHNNNSSSSNNDNSDTNNNIINNNNQIIYDSESDIHGNDSNSINSDVSNNLMDMSFGKRNNNSLHDEQIQNNYTNSELNIRPNVIRSISNQDYNKNKLKVQEPLKEIEQTHNYNNISIGDGQQPSKLTINTNTAELDNVTINKDSKLKITDNNTKFHANTVELGTNAEIEYYGKDDNPIIETAIIPDNGEKCYIDTANTGDKKTQQIKVNKWIPKSKADEERNQQEVLRNRNNELKSKSNKNENDQNEVLYDSNTYDYNNMEQESDENDNNVPAQSGYINSGIRPRVIRNNNKKLKAEPNKNNNDQNEVLRDNSNKLRAGPNSNSITNIQTRGTWSFDEQQDGSLKLVSDNLDIGDTSNLNNIIITVQFNREDFKNKLSNVRSKLNAPYYVSDYVAHWESKMKGVIDKNTSELDIINSQGEKYEMIICEDKLYLVKVTGKNKELIDEAYQNGNGGNVDKDTLTKILNGAKYKEQSNNSDDTNNNSDSNSDISEGSKNNNQGNNNENPHNNNENNHIISNHENGDIQKLIDYDIAHGSGGNGSGEMDEMAYRIIEGHPESALATYCADLKYREKSGNTLLREIFDNNLLYLFSPVDYSKKKYWIKGEISGVNNNKYTNNNLFLGGDIISKLILNTNIKLQMMGGVMRSTLKSNDNEYKSTEFVIGPKLSVFNKYIIFESLGLYRHNNIGYFENNTNEFVNNGFSIGSRLGININLSNKLILLPYVKALYSQIYTCKPIELSTKYQWDIAPGVALGASLRDDVAIVIYYQYNCKPWLVGDKSTIILTDPNQQGTNEIGLNLSKLISDSIELSLQGAFDISNDTNADAKQNNKYDFKLQAQVSKLF